METLKILNLIQSVEMLEDFIKCEYSSNKINSETANEILRLTTEIKEDVLK